MVDFVLYCYNDYNKFMDFKDNKIQINPIIKGNNLSSKSLAYIDAHEILQPIVNIYVSPKLAYKCDKRFQKVKLFHEFTHIIDANTLFENYPYEKFVTLMSTYSEYHASQIELACNVGFNNIHNFRKINLDKTFIVYENGQIDIKSDFLMQMIDALSIIDKPSDTYYNVSLNEYYTNYKMFKEKTIYYLGKKNFCDKYSFKRTADITEENYKSFYSYIKQIDKEIKDKNYDNLITSETELWNYYSSYFIYKDKDLLQSVVNN